MSNVNILIENVIAGQTPKEVLDEFLLDEGVKNQLVKARKAANDMIKDIQTNKISKSDLKKFFAGVQKETSKLAKKGVKITGKILVGIIKLIAKGIWKGALKPLLISYPYQTITALGSIGSFIVLAAYQYVADKFSYKFTNVMDPRERSNLDPDLEVKPA